MLKNMANCVIEKEQIVTTVEKAKEVRRVVDRLITLGKSGNPASRRVAFDRTRSNEIVSKLFTTLADRYKARAGGYTRVLKLSDRRWGDGANMAVLELVDHPLIDRKRKPKAEAAQEMSGNDAAAAKVADPMSKFRKLFKGKSKVAGGTGKAGRAAKSGGAARKTPAAGGGGSKSGGGSS
jgi:large subunit ribosomal protein L17